MSRFVSVTFRGESRDVEIDSDSGYEADTNAQEIEWHFVGLSADEHEALALTEAEETAIYQACVQAKREYEP